MIFHLNFTKDLKKIKDSETGWYNFHYIRSMKGKPGYLKMKLNYYAKRSLMKNHLILGLYIKEMEIRYIFSVYNTIIYSECKLCNWWRIKPLQRESINIYYSSCTIFGLISIKFQNL